MDNISESNISSSNADSNYFSSYEDIEVHRLMVKDGPRTAAYRDAILKNTHLFKGKVVMDVGAGTGILSLFAAKAGAKKVYAVEASNICKCIPSIAKINGYEDIIKVFHMRVEDFSLPTDEKVDIIISEWMGFYLFHESMLSSVIFAREKFLADEGTVFPTDVRLYACPCSLDNYFNEQFYFWENVYGFNMSPIKECAFTNKQTTPEIYEVRSSDLLAEPVCIKELNLLYAVESDTASFSCTNFVGITKSGNYQGLALWFVCDFEGRNYDTDGEEYGKLVSLSTSPFDPVTHWKQTVIVLGGLRIPSSETDLENSGGSSPKVPKLAVNNSDVKENDIDILCNHDQDFIVEEDEVVGWKLEFKRAEEEKRHYSIVMETLDPEEAEHPIPCVCPMPRCLIIAKMIEKEEDELVDQCQDES